MAGPPLSTRQTQTPGRFPDAKLNTALLDFAPRFMKEKLELLAQACDRRLERDLVPRLFALLRDIDQERDAFEQHKQDAARDLRDQLDLLRVDAPAIDEAIGHLHTVAPRYLDLLPMASSLAIPIPVASSLSAFSTAVSSDGTFDTPDADTNSQATATPPQPTSGLLSQPAQNPITQAKPCASSMMPPSLDSQVQAQVIAENTMASRSPKRPETGGRDENDTPCKRQKTITNKVFVNMMLS
jgi:hypothetical protein